MWIATLLEKILKGQLAREKVTESVIGEMQIKTTILFQLSSVVWQASLKSGSLKWQYVFYTYLCQPGRPKGQLTSASLGTGSALLDSGLGMSADPFALSGS